MRRTAPARRPCRSRSRRRPRRRSSCRSTSCCRSGRRRTWGGWGTDADGDGVADPWTATDAIYSAARYLAAAGGTADISRGVFAYNHAQWYVDEVLQLAQVYAGGGTEVVQNLDNLQ